MKSKEEIKVEIVGSDENQKSNGIIQIQFWDEKERLKRALKWAGMIFGFAVVSIFIPLAHFILVPGFLIATPIVSFFIYQQEKMVLGGSGVCPDCKSEISLAMSFRDFPLSDMCSRCQCGIKIFASRS